MPEETVDSIPGELMEEPEGALPARKKLGRLRIEEVTVELEKAQAENTSLREENDWLRSEIARLEGALVDANQTIYLLERKLDAIFKPNNVVEVIE
ncbi:MAG: hypothetical protein HY801_10180 [Candidatus Lindowbacteria bacterium]|nr:hypothetical protein [Candidatus Lindowbacteria bacterium]